MLDLITTSVIYLFPGGRALILTKNITLTVIDCYTFPFVRLAAHCIGASAVIAASVASLDPVTIGSVVHLISEIYDNCQKIGSGGVLSS